MVSWWAIPLNIGCIVHTVLSINSEGITVKREINLKQVLINFRIV